MNHSTNTHSLRKATALVLGSLCVIFGLLGIIIPILPTTPFLLLAAFFFARSSDRALNWLLNNRWFGRYIRNYREGRGMTAKEKAITLTLLWLTIGASVVFVTESLPIRLVLTGIAAGVSMHLLRVKTYRSEPVVPRTAPHAEVEASE